MQLQVIQNKIYELRDQKIMLDFDLAALYQVETRVLKQAVRRNIDRFPNDFMFQLDNSDIDLLVSQNVIPSKSHLGGALPFAFTEQGVAMLSSVLKSKVALQANIAIVRAFVALRKIVLGHKNIIAQIKELKEKLKSYDGQLSIRYMRLLKIF